MRLCQILLQSTAKQAALAAAFCSVIVIVASSLRSFPIRTHEFPQVSSFRTPQLTVDKFSPELTLLRDPDDRKEQTFRFPKLPDFKGVVFSGHYPAPDLDSVASAIGASVLFDGVAAVPGPINSESQFVLSKYGLENPAKLTSIYKTGEPYVLVDHNEHVQVPPTLKKHPQDLVGIIDHHTLARDPAAVTHPIYVDIRPWGSCSTIIATYFISNGVKMAKPVAGLLLAGIISDTLALKGPTTTEIDITTAKILVGFLDSGMINAVNYETQFFSYIHTLALEQFQAKANQTSKSLYTIVLEDFKSYELPHRRKDGARDSLAVGWGTVETVEPFYSEYLLKETVTKLAEVIMPRILREKKLDLVYISVVDILEEKSVFIACCSDEEVDILMEAFPKQQVIRAFNPPSGADGIELSGTPRVSRKKEFIPPLKKAIKKGP